jgi:hypothetical protein
MDPMGIETTTCMWFWDFKPSSSKKADNFAGQVGQPWIKGYSTKSMPWACKTDVTLPVQQKQLHLNIWMAQNNCAISTPTPSPSVQPFESPKVPIAGETCDVFPLSDFLKGSSLPWKLTDAVHLPSGHPQQAPIYSIFSGAIAPQKNRAGPGLAISELSAQQSCATLVMRHGFRHRWWYFDALAPCELTELSSGFTEDLLPLPTGDTDDSNWIIQYSLL